MPSPKQVAPRGKHGSTKRRRPGKRKAWRKTPEEQRLTLTLALLRRRVNIITMATIKVQRATTATLRLIVLDLVTGTPGATTATLAQQFLPYYRKLRGGSEIDARFRLVELLEDLRADNVVTRIDSAWHKL